jgi:hypothetical protein
MPFIKIGLGAKALEMSGGRMAVNVSDVYPVSVLFGPDSFAEIKPLTFVCGPAVVAITSTETSQLVGVAPEAKLPPSKLRLVAPTAGAVPVKPQVLVTNPAVAISTPAGKSSVNVIPVKS